MSTAEEAARLENAYRQAQIASAYADMPTEEDRALERQYRQAQIEKMLDESDSSGGDEMRIGSADDLDAVFGYVRVLKAAGDERAKDYAAAKELIRGIDGYDPGTMDGKLKDFLAQLYGGTPNARR